MTMSSLVVALAPHTGKITKNVLNVFERGENLLRNGIQFDFRWSQWSGIALEILNLYRRNTAGSRVLLGQWVSMMYNNYAFVISYLFSWFNYIITVLHWWLNFRFYEILILCWATPLQKNRKKMLVSIYTSLLM